MSSRLDNATSPGPHTVQGWIGSISGGAPNGTVAGAAGDAVGHTLENAGHRLA